MMLQALLGLLLQFSLCSLAAAAPMTAQGNNSAVGGWAGGGVVGFIVLILDIIAWVEVLKSNRPVPNKILWCLLVFLFPLGGVLVYYIFSNRAEHSSGGGYEAIPGA